MKVKPESRDKLKDGVDRRKRKLDKCEKHMKKVVKDKTKSPMFHANSAIPPKKVPQK